MSILTGNSSVAIWWFGSASKNITLWIAAVFVVAFWTLMISRRECECVSAQNRQISTNLICNLKFSIVNSIVFGWATGRSNSFITHWQTIKLCTHECEHTDWNSFNPKNQQQQKNTNSTSKSRIRRYREKEEEEEKRFQNTCAVHTSSDLISNTLRFFRSRPNDFVFLTDQIMRFAHF